MSLIATYTYEEGTNGSAIPTGSNGVLSQTNSTYSTAAAVHGALGASTVAGTIFYTVGNASGQESFYGSVGVAGSASSSIWQIRNSATQLARLRVDAANSKFEIADSSNTVQATSTVTWSVGAKYRIDVRHVYTAGTGSVTITARIFLGSNMEGTTPDDTITATFTLAAAPTKFGPASSTGWTNYQDTVRIYDDVTTWPAPYAAVTPPDGPDVDMISIDYYGSSIPASPTEGQVWLQTNPGSGAVPGFTDTFQSGTVSSSWDVVHGASVQRSYAETGIYGCRLTPDVSNLATLSLSTHFPGGGTHAWTVVAVRFRIVQKTAPTSSYTVIFEIGNSLPAEPKNQFTLYINGSGALVMDFNLADVTVIDPNPTVNEWHEFEARVNYGVTAYTAKVRYDGRLYAMTAGETTAVANSIALWVGGYPTVTTDQTIDVDEVSVLTADSDQQFLWKRDPVIRVYHNSVWY